MKAIHQKKSLLLLSTAIALGAGAPAWAQRADSKDTAASGNDILVTARRVEEKLQDVPISISVFNQAELTANNVVGAKDIAAFTPSLTVNTRYGSDASTFTLRGFTQEGKTTPTVAVYFADVVAPTGTGTNNGGDGAGPGSFFDLQNVQVLKGPQGTLFGRNTTGGAVLLVPKKPTNEFEGYLEGSLGEYDLRRVQGVINIPVNDSVRLRFGVDHNERDGYLKNLSPLGTRNLGNVDYTAVRFSASIDLSPSLENYTVASYTDSKSSGNIPSIKECYAPVAAVPGIAGSAIPGTYYNQCLAQVAREKSSGFWTVEDSQPNGKSNMEQYQVINTTTWDATDNLTVKNTVSYASFNNNVSLDLFGTYFPNVPAGTEANYSQVSFFAPIRALQPSGHTNDQYTFTEELQLQGTALEDRLNWQAGAYYELSSPDGPYGAQNPNSNLTGGCADPDNFICTASTTMTYNSARQKFSDYALYAQGTYKLTDKLSATAGIRYTWDKGETTTQVGSIRFPTANNPTFQCSNATAPGFGTVYPIARRFDACKQRFSVNSEAPTWVLDLDYKPVDNVLVYGKYSRGYRRNTTVSFTVDGLQDTLKPEKLDSYEAGLKSSWKGVIPGTFNVAAFYNDFSDQQFQIGITLAATPTSGLVNAKKSEIYGLETELSLTPIEGLDLNLAYAHLESKVKSFPAAGVVANDGRTIAVDNTFAGYELPFAIPDKVSFGANYTLPLDESIGKIKFGATYVWQSSYRVIFPSIVPNTNTRPPTLARDTDFGNLPSYSFGNLNASWEDMFGKPIDLGLFVTNVTNEEGYTHVNDQNVRGFVSYFLNEPRMWGARVRYKF